MQKIVNDIKILKSKSKDVGYFEKFKIIKELQTTLQNTKNGIGLSAIQIGIPKRVSIIRLPNFKINLINEEIIEKSDPIRVKDEGCLSFPGLFLDTKRYNIIKLKNGKTYTGLRAVAIQHELDHTNGIVFLDRKWRKRK